jgi:hypothetical protein
MLSKLWNGTAAGRSAASAKPVPLQAEESYSTGDFSIDDHRPIKVICIGAGFSGILSAIRYVVPRAV